jgi:hypothetical protein
MPRRERPSKRIQAAVDVMRPTDSDATVVVRAEDEHRLGVWPVVDDPVANQTFADLDTLEAVLVTRC